MLLKCVLGLLGFVLVLGRGAAGEDVINADLVNVRVQRTVELSSHLPKISTRITLENTAKSAIKYFLIAIDPQISGNLSFIGAAVSIKYNIVRSDGMTNY